MLVLDDYLIANIKIIIRDKNKTIFVFSWIGSSEIHVRDCAKLWKIVAHDLLGYGRVFEASDVENVGFLSEILLVLVLDWEASSSVNLAIHYAVRTLLLHTIDWISLIECDKSEPFWPVLELFGIKKYIEQCTVGRFWKKVFLKIRK